MFLDVSLKFLSFSWHYWGNIHAYGVLVCFCVRQFVFEVVSVSIGGVHLDMVSYIRDLHETLLGNSSLMKN